MVPQVLALALTLTSQGAAPAPIDPEVMRMAGALQAWHLPHQQGMPSLPRLPSLPKLPRLPRAP